MPDADGGTGAPLSAGEAARLFEPLRRYRHVALAVSGGADSAALLWLAAQWRDGGPQTPAISVLTVDHGLRPEAAGECRQVVAWARQAGFPGHILKVAAPAPAGGVQAWARHERYQALFGWCRAHDAGALATGHTRDDQAETVLMRLARGSGVDGLAGMAAVCERDGIALVRPLLAVGRKRLTAVLNAAGRGWIEDPGNDDPGFERVRWRRRAGLLAAAGLGPEALCRTARRAGRARAALDSLAAGLLERSAAWFTTGHGEIDLATLAAAPEELRLRALIQVAGVAGGGGEVPLAGAERLLDWLDYGHSPARTFAGCRLQRRARTLVVGREPGRVDATPVPLRAGGETRWDGRFAVTTGTSGSARLALGPLGDRLPASQRVKARGLPAFVRRALPAVFLNGEVVAVPALRFRAAAFAGPIIEQRLLRLPPGLSASDWPPSAR